MRELPKFKIFLSSIFPKLGPRLPCDIDQSWWKEQIHENVMRETQVFLTYVRCLVPKFKFYRIFLSIQATQINDIFLPLLYLCTCLAELCCANIGKNEIDDKCCVQLGCNIMTILAVTIKPMSITTKFVITAVKTKLVVLAYFYEFCNQDWKSC